MEQNDKNFLEIEIISHSNFDFQNVDTKHREKFSVFNC